MPGTGYYLLVTGNWINEVFCRFYNYNRKIGQRAFECPGRERAGAIGLRWTGQFAQLGR